VIIHSSKTFKQKAGDLWPRMKEPNLIWLRGTQYKAYENLDHLKEVVKANSLREKYKYVKGGYECEFKATQLMSAVWDHHYNIDVRAAEKVPDEADQYFFGLCIGLGFKTCDGNHNVNIATFGDCEIALIDQDHVWIPGKSDDPYFIFR
jgi:hypothetical protein